MTLEYGKSFSVNNHLHMHIGIYKEKCNRIFGPEPDAFDCYTTRVCKEAMINQKSFIPKWKMSTCLFREDIIC